MLLDVKEAGEITLIVSYLVTAAKWVPKYDIRAFSDDSVVKVIFSRQTNDRFESINLVDLHKLNCLLRWPRLKGITELHRGE